MARPKEFDRQTALGAAMEVFWARGYEATTMTALRRAMGIGRQSLYDTFGDKKQIFAEALDRYVRRNREDVAAHLNAEVGLDGIRAFFEGRVRMLSSGARHGCLMINTAVELGPHDAKAAAKVESGLDDMRAGFAAALQSAIDDGDVPAATNVADLAAFLTSQIAGMVVMAKNGASEDDLRAIAHQALRALT